jgi:hypothetical protein
MPDNTLLVWWCIHFIAIRSLIITHPGDLTGREESQKNPAKPGFLEKSADG